MRGGEVRACAWVRAAWVSAPSTFTIARVSPTRCCTGAVLATRAAVASGWVVAAFAAPSIGTITRVSPTRCCARGPILARATVASGGLVTRSATPSIGTTTRVIATVRRAGGTVLARAAVASVRWRRRRRRRRVKLSAGFRRESDQQAHLQEQEHPAADNWRCTRPESPPGASRGSLSPDPADRRRRGRLCVTVCEQPTTDHTRGVTRRLARGAAWVFACRKQKVRKQKAETRYQYN